MKRFGNSLCATALALTLAACGTPPTMTSGPQTGEREVRQGVIEQITPTEITSDVHPGVGAVVGGLVGLGIGSLIGGGTGRDVAMVLGTVGGAITGHEAVKKYDKPVAGQQVVVRLGNGVLVSVTQPTNPALRQGQPVYIEGSGTSARVIAR